MATNDSDAVYLFERTELERQRLNQQHALLVRLCHDHLLHRSIPRDQIKRIADVGTGTGIWLQQASRSLNTAATADSEAPPVACVGFDISDAHFPSAPRENMTFVKHDMLKPFPQEYRGTFDLVHLRLMVLALKKEQIATAAENAAALLKPGGYVQWSEVEPAKLEFTPTTPAITAARAAMRANSVAKGLATTPSVDIRAALEALSFTDLTVEDYSSAGRDEFTVPAREWTKAGARAGLRVALARSGQDGGQETADTLLDDYVRDIDAGVVPTLPLAMVVGRKGKDVAV
ncbi:LaeA-like methyltransferase [Metarhizium robertsii ARSEF 23]|uniref:LaeA-like methyltransferase n=1 Tax=Metarhizium robertsii (strain ARSEF 23 / ATCC MYA-3075) TaxID=655844 RepID=E9EJF5_METRA|nr:LaeA-like methyltransferase [Metarhizium robertsii ARSEF 23]EFZ04275.2 LaeA-like methyltransferase [Metarhizium robertsii ARSEF 23]